jgi:hypothetical protein
MLFICCKQIVLPNAARFQDVYFTRLSDLKGRTVVENWKADRWLKGTLICSIASYIFGFSFFYINTGFIVVGLYRLDTGILGSNPARGMDVYSCLFVLCCLV